MKYFFVGFTSFKRSFAYQFNVYIGFILVIIVAVSSKYFWKAFVNAGKIPENELVNYVTYSVMAAIMTSIFINELIIIISEKIRWGSITTDLQKPVDFQLFSISEAFGDMAGNLVLKLIPCMIIIKLIVNIYIPGSIVTLLLFLISSLLGYCVLITFDYIVSLLAFYFVEIWAFQALKNVIIGFCSGTFLPLWLFPESVLNVLNLLPFKYFMFVPLNIYLGKINGSQIIYSLIGQFLWAIALYITGKVLTWFAVRKLAVAGG